MAELSLTRVANYLKSEWFLVTLGGLSILLITLAILSFSKNKINNIPPGTPWQNNIYAGQTTKKELESKLGKPIKTAEEDKTIYFYPSTDQYRPNRVEFSEDIVNVIKEQVIGDGKGGLNDYIQKYNQPETELFGPHGTFAPGHFWGKKGILVFANKFDGTIVEIWYFAPTTLNDFLQKNPSLSLEEPKNF